MPYGSILEAALSTSKIICPKSRQGPKNGRNVSKPCEKKKVGLEKDKEHLEEVGKYIDKTQDTYQTAMRRLRDGKGNLVRQVEMLRDLGADTSKHLPAEFERALDEDSE